MGALYVYTNWKGSDTDVKLSEAAKVKNFLWLLASASLPFIADFNAIDPKADKSALVGTYLLCAVLTILVGLAAWCLWVAITALWIRLRAPAQYPNPPFDPVSDFLILGYTGYQKRFKELVETKSKEWAVNFLRRYSEFLSISTGCVQKRMSENKPDKQGIESILVALCWVLQSIYQDKTPKIHTRFLRAYPPAETPAKELQYLRFAPRAHQTYAYFLVLEASNLDASGETITITLPVEKLENANSSLPGAPMAFAEGTDQLCDDIQTMDLGSLDKSIQTDLRKYLKERKFRSLSAFLLKNPVDERPFGVLTIESGHKNSLGKTAQKQLETKALLRPFIQLLEIAAAPPLLIKPSGSDRVPQQ